MPSLCGFLGASGGPQGDVRGWLRWAILGLVQQGSCVALVTDFVLCGGRRKERPRAASSPHLDLSSPGQGADSHTAPQTSPADGFQVFSCPVPSSLVVSPTGAHRCRAGSPGIAGPGLTADLLDLVGGRMDARGGEQGYGSFWGTFGWLLGSLVPIVGNSGNSEGGGG